MSYAESILPEFEHETANTRKVLESVPEDKLDWRAHPRSNTIGWNANHLAVERRSRPRNVRSVGR